MKGIIFYRSEEGPKGKTKHRLGGKDKKHAEPIRQTEAQKKLTHGRDTERRPSVKKRKGRKKTSSGKPLRKGTLKGGGNLTKSRQKKEGNTATLIRD